MLDSFAARQLRLGDRRQGTPYPSGAAASGRVQSQVRKRLSSRRPVRSRWIGVTEIRRLMTAWKSVPLTASPDGGGPPIQK